MVYGCDPTHPINPCISAVVFIIILSVLSTPSSFNFLIYFLFQNIQYPIIIFIPKPSSPGVAPASSLSTDRAVWSVLHCTALHCTALHCTALHCTALHWHASYYTSLHCTALHYTFQSKGNVGFFKLISSLCASGYWLSSAARVTSDYMEDNILVYSTFNLVTTLTIYITSAWHIHIIIPKMNIEDKKDTKN